MAELLTMLGRNLTVLVLWVALILLTCFLLAVLVEFVRAAWRSWSRHEADRQAARDHAWLRRQLELTHARSQRYRAGAGQKTPDGPDGPGRAA